MSPLCHRGHTAWHGGLTLFGRAGAATRCYCGTVCRTHQFVPRYCERRSLWRRSRSSPASALSSAYLCYPRCRFQRKKKKKKGGEGRQDRRRDDELCLAIWAPFLQRPQIKTQPVWRGGGGGGGGEGGKQNCQKATILLISFSLCALSKEGERKKGALIIRGVESSNRWNNVPLLFFSSPPIVCNDSRADGEASLRMTFKCWHLNYVCLSEGEWPARFCCASFCARGLAARRYSSWRVRFQSRVHFPYAHTHIPTTAHRNPEGAILDGFVKVRESVETVYTKNFNGFYFKRLQRKSHQIVTTNIKSLIVTNPPDCIASLSAWLISSWGQARTPFSAAKMLNPITLHVNLQEASYT